MNLYYIINTGCEKKTTKTIRQSSDDVDDDKMMLDFGFFCCFVLFNDRKKGFYIHNSNKKRLTIKYAN